MKKYEPIVSCKYGKLADKVKLEPDFFTGFQPERRQEIVKKEAEFYHSITEPYSVDDQLDKYYIQVTAKDGYSIPVKVYMPKKRNEKIPALVFIHGGGFMTCSVETHDFVPSYIAAKTGSCVYNVEYRLAPEYKFPVGVEDCYEVLRWVFDHAEELGIDRKRLMVGGDSSGGNFSAVLTLLSRERKEFNIEKQILIYPALDFSGTIYKKSAEVYTMVGSDEDGSSPMLDAYLKDVKKEVLNPYVSPLLAENLEELPQALFIEAECDALIDDGLIYAKRLQDAGVCVECHIYIGMPHAFILRTYEETFQALDEICRFVQNEN